MASTDRFPSVLVKNILPVTITELNIDTKSANTRAMADQTKPKKIPRRWLKNLWSQIAIVGPALALVVAGFIFAGQFVGPAPPDRILMATGSSSGAYQAFAQKYAERFKSEGIELVLKNSAGSAENLNSLTATNSDVPVAFLQGGIGSPQEYPELRSLGSVYYEPLWVFVRGDKPIEFLTSLAGRRIAVGAKGSGTRAIALRLLRENGVTAEQATLIEIGGLKSAQALKAGEIDAAIFVTSATSNTVRGLLATPGITLMNFDRADAYIRLNRFLSKLVLPKGAVDLVANLPEKDVTLLAPTATVVASPELHPALIDLLLLTMKDVHRPGGLLEEPDEFPSGRYITYPLNDAAQRFYDKGPPFLQRFLPFWAANLIDRLKVMILP
ncbi:MAG: C4-dicarboxylate ABC transporter substrate-binding protein [Rhodospirillaceae bacterium]|nr:C4-dicarboxylate ABC transporter substrate-binding protein [Rhodospirillaceae bacterium]